MMHISMKHKQHARTTCNSKMKIMKNGFVEQYLEISVAMLKPIFIFSLPATPSPLE
jgi:hypothetical protein